MEMALWIYLEMLLNLHHERHIDAGGAHMRVGALIGVVLVVGASACGGMDQPPVTGSTMNEP